MTLGTKIRYYRNHQKKSQKDIAVRTGIPQTTLSGWENDKSEPTISDAKKLAIALGVTVNELLDDKIPQKDHDDRSKLDKKLVG